MKTKIKLTEEWLRGENPCSDGLAFAARHKFNFRKIYAACPRSDWLLWLLRRAQAIDKPQAVQVSIACAEHVLDMYEKKYPEDKRPRQAIEAAQAWLQNPTEENRKAAAAAAAAAAYDAAAYDAYAAAAAAAYAAYAAAYDAAAYDTYAAAAAAAAAKIKEQKWQANQIRKLIPNPFA
jgi:Immunity protein Imm5